MPKKAVENGLPKPVGNNVTLGKVGAARFAVLGFSGSRATQIEQGSTEQLHAWFAQQKLTGEGAPLFACYGPPWTHALLRRNKVMIRIAKRHD